MSIKAFEKIMPGINPGVIGFQHKGEWAIHEALTVLLSRTGPANVMMETFNISEDALRPMFFEIEKGNITNLKLKMLLFAASITTNIRIASCHAKVLLIHNDRFKVGLIGSANANQPIRYEAGFIFSEPRLFDFFETKFTQVFNEDSIPFEWNSP